MANLSLRHVKKVYDGNVVAVQDFNLEIADKEFIVLVGPSGCGKSTTLRMVAGLEEITEGEIYINNVLVNRVPPKDRDIAMVFQNYALYPHMTVYDNIAYGLKLRKFPKRVIDQKVREAAEILDITELLRRKPKALSGGQRQRVAIGRAIVREPHVFLMDEPLSNLDAKLRVYMRTEIRRIQQQFGITAIYVTHDQSEAMSISDEIIIMKKGVVAQMGSPKDIYYHPTDEFVADFIGEANFIKGTVKGMQGNDCVVTVEGREVTVETDTPRDAGAEGEIVLRPEAIRIAPEGLLPCTVELSCFMGSYQNYHVRLEDGTLVKITDSCPLNKRVFEVGERAAISFDKDCAHLL